MMEDDNFNNKSNTVGSSDLRRLTKGDAKAVLVGFGVHDIPKERWYLKFLILLLI